MRFVHWMTHDTTLLYRGVNTPVTVEVTLSSDRDNDVEIEGLEVKLSDSNVEIIPSDDQMFILRKEIYEEFEPDDPADDWRNEW